MLCTMTRMFGQFLKFKATVLIPSLIPKQCIGYKSIFPSFNTLDLTGFVGAGKTQRHAVHY